jgi:hypothetical protein
MQGIPYWYVTPLSGSDPQGLPSIVEPENTTIDLFRH